MEDKEPKYTFAYSCYRRYMDYFFAPSNLSSVMRECRDFIAGKQYRFDTINDMPKPCFNIMKEHMDKFVNKLLETECSYEFVCDDERINLSDLDSYYEFQMDKIDNDDFIARCAEAAFTDGTGVMITAFDKDTLGSETLFKGFLKRQLIPFEDTFWDNGNTEDEQDQRYCGYTFAMEVGAVKDLIEGDEKTKKEKSKLVVPEDYFESLSSFETMNPSEIDTKLTQVYVRFFRVDGEVFFEMCTKYCPLFEYPHSLNPRLNKTIGKRLAEEAEKRAKAAEEGEEPEDAKEIFDYSMDYARYTLFEQAVSETPEEHKKEKAKFSRYPITLLKLDPIPNKIYGRSVAARDVANQKLINLIFLYITLILQYHAQPKWMEKNGALNGQVITNDPSQVLIDYSPITSNVDWGITRLGAGDAVNNNIVEIGQQMILLTRQIGGFADIAADNTDTSGYALEQKIHQSNIILEQMQKRLWKFREKLARLDLMYFRHYIESGKFYVQRSESEVEMQENYRMLAQDNINAGTIPNPVEGGGPLPKTPSLLIKDVSHEMFDASFDVCIKVEQGIASSEISEAQHYENIFQYILSGNVDADKIRVMIQNDPSFSRKTRSRIIASLDALEVSQLQIKNDEIAKLQAYIEQLTTALKSAQQGISYMNAVRKADQQAFAETTAQQRAVNQTLVDNAQAQSEGQVKSNNSKGVSGGTIAAS